MKPLILEDFSLYLRFIFIHSIIGLVETARLFIEKGVNVNKVNNKNDTALIGALEKGETKFQMNLGRSSVIFS